MSKFINFFDGVNFFFLKFKLEWWCYWIVGNKIVEFCRAWQMCWCFFQLTLWAFWDVALSVEASRSFIRTPCTATSSMARFGRRLSKNHRPLRSLNKNQITILFSLFTISISFYNCIIVWFSHLVAFLNVCLLHYWFWDRTSKWRRLFGKNHRPLCSLNKIK